MDFDQTSGAQSHDLRVRFPEPRVTALADDRAVAHDDRADHRVRRRLPPPFPGQLQGPAHIPLV